MESSEVVKSQQLEQYEAQDISPFCDAYDLSEIVRSVDKAAEIDFRNDLYPIEGVELGLIATSSDGVSISLVRSVYKTTLNVEGRSNSLYLSDEVVQLIESQFLSIYQSMIKYDKKNMWNKAKMTIYNNVICRQPILKFKYDSDLDWVESLDVNGSEYNELSPDIEEKINQWEGLPKNFPRMWIH